jgi:soluble lytic murein transglycosylase-like protein
VLIAAGMAGALLATALTAVLGLGLTWGGGEGTVSAKDLRRQLALERAKHAQALQGAARQRERAQRAAARAQGLGAESQAEHAVRAAAAAYGVEPGRLLAVARCESTLNPAATNGPYVGLFQFGAPLWDQTPFRDFSRSDPYANALAAAWAFSHGMGGHWPSCGSR